MAENTTKISNPGVGMLKDIDSELHKRQVQHELIPSFVSADTYKNILDRKARNEQVLKDYFYLLDLALRGYNRSKDDISIYVFAKYIVDNSVYISDIPATTMKEQFDAKYKNIDTKEAMKYLNEVATLYRQDKNKINRIIFGEMSVNQAQCPSCVLNTIKPEVVYVTKQEACPKVTTTQEVMRKPALALKPTLEQFVSLFKTAVDCLVTNKTDFYNLYQNRLSNLEFLKVPKFAPVLAYAKYLEDNQHALNMIDPIQQRDALDAAVPQFFTNRIYYVQGIHVQLFIILATELYQTNPTEVNQLLASLI